MISFDHAKFAAGLLDGPVLGPRGREEPERAVVRAAPRCHPRRPPSAGGPALPSRQLAGQLGVSRHTVITAYGHLVTPEGYIEGRAGGGSVVAPAAPAPSRGAGPRQPSTQAAALRLVPPTMSGPNPAAVFDLRAGLPEPALFPVDLWRRRVAAAISANRRPEYGDPAGQIRLRRAIAHWISRSRSVTRGEDAIVITSGAQHAIDLLARVLLEPGEVRRRLDPARRDRSSSCPSSRSPLLPG